MSDETENPTQDVVRIAEELRDALSFLRQSARNYGYFGGASLREMVQRRIDEIGPYEGGHTVRGRASELTKISALIELRERLLGPDGVISKAEEVHRGAE